MSHLRSDTAIQRPRNSNYFYVTKSFYLEEFFQWLIGHSPEGTKFQKNLLGNFFRWFLLNPRR